MFGITEATAMVTLGVRDRRLLSSLLLPIFPFLLFFLFHILPFANTPKANTEEALLSNYL